MYNRFSTKTNFKGIISKTDPIDKHMLPTDKR